MIPVLTAAEMREADRRTIEEIGLPGVVLMENAGAAVAGIVRARFSGAVRIRVLCGRGNNGGDGFVVARHLVPEVSHVDLIGSREAVRGDARVHMGVYERSGGRLREIPDAQAWERVREEVLRADLVVDALLGTGLHEKPTGLVAAVISDLARFPGTVVSVDMPSGLPSDTGEVSWETVNASLTVAFAAPKYGHVIPPACDRVGELVVVDIGIPRGLLRAQLFRLEAADAAVVYGDRPRGAHKGSYGHTLVIAGSVGKTGAAILAAAGALRAGSGLVTIATTPTALPLVASGRPEVMTEPLPTAASGDLGDQAVERALVLAKESNAVVLGPGLGQGGREFVRAFVARCPVPLVVDADGLNALSPTARSKSATHLLRRALDTVVTPHPGEMGRLVGSSAADVQRRRLETARAFSMENGAFVVLKGQATIVADPGGRAAVNPTGNPGMATGGTGDVLAGILGSLLGRGHGGFAAATAAVYIHGLAGDLAARKKGQESMLAGDLVDALPEAIEGVRHP